jgi:hypothetical protein
MQGGFTGGPLHPTTISPSVRSAQSRVSEYTDDSFADRVPVPPPSRLMNRRLPFAVWIVMAFLLGGLIATVLFLLASD